MLLIIMEILEITEPSCKLRLQPAMPEATHAYATLSPETMIKKKAARAFTLVEMLLVVAIISILAAMVISNFSNASQDTRAVIARQQLAVVQEAVNHWANYEIGRVTTTGGTGKTVNQVMTSYNAATFVATTAAPKTRWQLFWPYLDDSTQES